MSANALDKVFIEDLDLKGKRVLVRVDFNVPLDGDLNITDTSRIDASLPTIQTILDKGGKAVLMSHLGRPKGKRVNKMSLYPAAVALGQKLNRPVILAPDCIGPGVEILVSRMQEGEVVLLENLRFYKQETDNDETFSKELAKLADVYINDAFGTAHRAHASTEGVARHVESKAIGYLIKKELDYLGKAIADPKKPFAAILGGAKVSDKIKVIENLLDKVQMLVIGGGMANTFLKAKGIDIGDSLFEETALEMAKDVIGKAAGKGVELLLPVDAILAQALEAGTETKVADADAGVPAGWKILDIGPKTLELFKAKINTAMTVFWNGPMGVFEVADFSKGTFGVAEALAEVTAKGAITIIGGGDSAAAINQAGLDSKISHLSTGGGASLEFVEGKVLPGVAAIPNK